MAFVPKKLKKKMREKEEGSSPTLPAEAIEEILSRLPVKSLMRFRCVSKQWRSLFIDPAFITKHLNRSTQKIPTHIFVEHNGNLYTSEIESGTQTRELHLLPAELPCYTYRIEALCDGLVCLNFGKAVGLYNPATREFLLLPKEKEEVGKDFWNTYFGLGFDPITKKYKLVKVTEIDDCRSSISIYTFGPHRWKRIIHSIPFTICYRLNASVTVSGAVHWVAVSKIRSVSRPETILSFDFQREIFQEVPLPEFGLCHTEFYLCVGVRGRCLSVFTNTFKTHATDIWVMKEYGVKESWTKLFTMSGIHYHTILSPKGFCKDGEILLQKDGTDLILYNPESETDTKLEFHGLPRFFHSASYMESLVCLQVGIGEPTKS